MSDDERTISGSGSDSEDIETTGLIATRAKRATAGNLYASLRANLDDEDLQKELLAEDADDVGDYEGSDREDDEDAFDSSSDEEDAGPPKDGEAEDLTGEKEVKRAERAEANKKRKAKDARLKLPTWQKKKVKLADDVKTEDGASERPKKKSERANWIPTPADAPTRQSSRASARANREVTHAKLKQSFARSEKQRQVMKSAAEREEKGKRLELTLEERLQKAAKIEKETKRDFNRWEVEEAERQRIRDEQLAAKRRKVMDGPFVRYWSGSVIWEGDTIKVKRVLSERKRLAEEEKSRQEAKEAEAKEAEAASAEKPHTTPSPDTVMRDVEGSEAANVSGLPEPEQKHITATPQQATDGIQNTLLHTEPSEGTTPAATRPASTGAAAENNKLTDARPAPETEVPSLPESSSQQAESSVPWLQGIEEYASLPEVPSPPTHDLPAPPALTYMPSAPIINGPPAYEVPSLLPPPQPMVPNLNPQAPPQPTTLPSLEPAAPPPLPVQAQRSLLILEQFPNLSTTTASLTTRKYRTTTTSATSDVTTILLPDCHPALTPDQAKYISGKQLKKRGGDVPPKQRCAITSWIAKYRDPKTGLAYADMHTYKLIQRVLDGGCSWSPLLGSWVGPAYGPMGRPALGVPEGFTSLVDVAPKGVEEEEKDNEAEEREGGVDGEETGGEGEKAAEAVGVKVEEGMGQAEKTVEKSVEVAQ